MIDVRNQKNPARGSHRYSAEDFYWLQVSSVVFEDTHIGEKG